MLRTRVTRVPTSEITVANPDVLASVRMHVRQAVERKRYPSARAWAEAVMASAEKDPVWLYKQRDGSLLLLDGNHRYFAATITGRPLPAIIR